MSNLAEVSVRLADMVRGYNRELALDALLRVLLGVVFSFLIFGWVFCVGWFVGFLFGHYINLYAWQFALIFAGLFFVVATWSAWRRVDPMAGLERLSEMELTLTLLSQVTPGIQFFSPRHATAGMAIVLIGGPANVIQGFGIWATRLRNTDLLIDSASRLLAACEPGCSLEEVEDPAAAVLLRRLALIKIGPGRDDSPALILTDKGRAVLGGRKSHRSRRL